jgi:hypothetical protein
MPNFPSAGFSAIVAGLVATLAAIGFVASARADVITLDVSAIFYPPLDVMVNCTPGCSLGGDIEINNTTGAILSEDVTANDFLPVVASPLTINEGVSNVAGSTVLKIDNSAGDTLSLALDTTTAGSLVGYTGGDIVPSLSELTIFEGYWLAQSGTLTETQTAVPEPASLALLSTALAGLGLIRRRKRSSA